jgi:sugar phosphate isomerase/epimerase
VRREYLTCFHKKVYLQDEVTRNILNMLNRRNFIRQSSAIAGGVLVGARAFAFPQQAARLSFSTLGCPKWPLPKILDFAGANGYSGVEIRGILGEMNLTKCPEFNSPSAIAATKKQFAEKQLKVVNLGASAELHHADTAKRNANLDGAKQFIDLAAALGSPFIRVFPNSFPKEQIKSATIDLIIDGLNQLGEYSKGTGVTVLMETHGDVVMTDDLLYIMQHAGGQNVGLVWDFYNMWTQTSEAPANAYAKLHPYIRHTHIKDSKKVNGKENYVFLGRGEAPVAEAIAALRKGGYKGFYSFEWEKLWHPEIAEPELALADFPTSFRKYL